MQTILVLITFGLATGYLIRKFIWSPIFDGKQKTTPTLDGGKTKCGKKDCACH